MVLVTKDDVVKLKTPQLNAVLYLKGASWGPSVGTAPEKRETVWRLLSGNSAADAVPVSDTLWNTAVRVTAQWRVADLEGVRNQLQAEGSGERPGAALADTSANGGEIPLDDATMADCSVAERAQKRRPSTPPAGGRSAKQAARQPNHTAGSPDNNGASEMAPSPQQSEKTALQRLQSDLRRLAPALEQIVGALSAVQRSIENDTRSAVASATVRQETKVANALGAAQAMLAGLGAERLRSTLESVPLPPKTMPNGLHGAHRPTGTRSWRDVAASTPPPRRTPLAWDPARTIILRPTDAQWATRTISSYNFGEALRGLFPMEGADDDERYRIDSIVRLSTGAFKMQLSPAAMTTVRSQGAKPFDVSPFGTWAVASGATPPGSSLVVAGVPEDLSEQEVATALVMGTERTLPDTLRPSVRELRVQRLKKRVRSDAGPPGDRTAPIGAREVRAASAPEFAPSRCCRVFGAPDLINLIIERGHMNLRWSVVPVRQYNPPTFWCATCKRRGSHSTRFHRQTVNSLDG